MSNIKFIAGSGAVGSRLVLVGEAPGASEAKAGQPFVGQSGQLLTNMLSDVGLTRQDVYTTNVVKVRPENNRTPSAEEIKSWLPTLRSEMDLFPNSLKIALGAVAAKALLGSRFESVTSQRGSVIDGVLITYHPAYILRNPKASELLLKDLQLAKDIAFPTEVA